MRSWSDMKCEKSSRASVLLQKVEVLLPSWYSETPFVFSFLFVKNVSILPSASLLPGTLQVLILMVTFVIINPNPVLPT